MSASDAASSPRSTYQPDGMSTGRSAQAMRGGATQALQEETEDHVEDSDACCEGGRKRVGAAGRRRSGRTRTHFNQLTCMFAFIFTIRTPYTVTCSVRSLDMHGFERVSAHKRAVSGANSA